MDINLSRQNVVGAWIPPKGFKLTEQGLPQFLSALKARDGFDASKVTIVPCENSSLWTFFLFAWKRKFGPVGQLALNVATNGGPVMNLGKLTSVQELFAEADS